MHEYTLPEIWSICTSNETFYYPGEYINSISLCTQNFENDPMSYEGAVKSKFTPEGLGPAGFYFAVRVDACPVKLYYAHHIQDLTDRSGEWVFPGTESA